jgi:hypothetical protein
MFFFLLWAWLSFGCYVISRSTFWEFLCHLPFSHSHSYPKEKPVVRVTLEPAAAPPIPAKSKKPKSRNGVEGLKEEKAKRKKTKQEKEENAPPLPPTTKGVNLNDDLDFWLSASNGNDAKEKKVVAKGELTIDETATAADSQKTAKKKKDKKEKKEKKAKKEKKKKDIKDFDDQNNHLSDSVIAPVVIAWKSLVDDKRLVMVKIQS